MSLQLRSLTRNSPLPSILAQRILPTERTVAPQLRCPTRSFLTHRFPLRYSPLLPILAQHLLPAERTVAPLQLNSPTCSFLPQRCPLRCFNVPPILAERLLPAERTVAPLQLRSPTSSFLTQRFPLRYSPPLPPILAQRLLPAESTVAPLAFGSTFNSKSRLLPLPRCSPPSSPSSSPSPPPSSSPSPPLPWKGWKEFTFLPEPWRRFFKFLFFVLRVCECVKCLLEIDKKKAKYYPTIVAIAVAAALSFWRLCVLWQLRVPLSAGRVVASLALALLLSLSPGCIPYVSFFILILSCRHYLRELIGKVASSVFVRFKGSGDQPESKSGERPESRRVQVDVPDALPEPIKTFFGAVSFINEVHETSVGLSNLWLMFLKAISGTDKLAKISIIVALILISHVV